MNASPYKEEEVREAVPFSFSPSMFQKYQPRAEEKTAAPRNEREEMLDRFVKRLNLDREKAGFKPLTYPRVAKMLQGIPTGDLHAVYEKCSTYRAFGAGLKYELTPKI